jgi:hypothetical protein
VVPEIGRDNYRELFIDECRLIYEVGGNFVRVQAIIHGRRDSSAIAQRGPG